MGIMKFYKDKGLTEDVNLEDICKADLSKKNDFDYQSIVLYARDGTKGKLQTTGNSEEGSPAYVLVPADDDN